jgi:predicted O-methyltransferase YrrM
MDINYYQKITGSFDFDDVYDKAVNDNSDGAIFVEVGCSWGKSAAYLGSRIKMSNKKIKLYAVDIWDSPEGWEHLKDWNGTQPPTLDGFLQNMKNTGVDDIIEPIRITSVAASKLFADNSLDFVFIDANHELKYITEDLHSWYPKVKKGGIIAGHDYWYVRGTVDAFFKEKNEQIREYRVSFFVNKKS